MRRKNYEVKTIDLYNSQIMFHMYIKICSFIDVNKYLGGDQTVWSYASVV